MSRIAVVTASPVGAEGGHSVIARALVQALREAGHEPSLVMTPANRFGRQGAAYLATWFTDVGMTHDGHAIDQVISLRFPSYAVRHERHVCWLNHRMREYYDLWERFSATLGPRTRFKERVRRACIHATDRYLLKHRVRRVFAQSKTIQTRLERWGRIASEVLYPPPPPRAYRCDGYGDYVLAVSRLTPLKRLDLVIRSLAEPDAAGVRLVVVGEGEEAANLHVLAAELGVAHRVQFTGPLDDEGLVTHLAQCRAVCFPPVDEDYGFVTVEAFRSGKAVVTCADSGGPTELVRDGINGFVCAPTPASVGLALARLTGDRTLAERMGMAGQTAAASMSWDEAVRGLLLV